MSMFDYMLKSLSGKGKEAPKESPTAPDAKEELRIQKENELKARLKKLVYQDNIVDELLPVFSKLDAEQSAPIFELLETKEQVISTLFDRESPEEEESTENNFSEEQEQEEPEDVLTAEEIIRAKYSDS